MCSAKSADVRLIRSTNLRAVQAFSEALRSSRHRDRSRSGTGKNDAVYCDRKF
jgi:hypothetical protein